jgi:osmotically-inducible protein OsmY
MGRSIFKVLAVGLALGWAPAALAQGPQDAKLALKAAQALYKEPGFIDVEVQVMGGGMVYLRGNVASEELSKKAEQVVKIPGSKDVRNRVTVAAPDVAAASDADIKTKIQQEISEDEDLAKSQLNVQVDKGNVSIEGKVNDYTVAATLVSEIRKIDGVQSINFDKLSY